MCNQTIAVINLRQIWQPELTFAWLIVEKVFFVLAKSSEVIENRL